MNRALRIALTLAAVLLSGTVAFAVVASTAPPGVDHIQSVVTNRPASAAVDTPSSPLHPPTSAASTATPDVLTVKPSAGTAPADIHTAVPRVGSTTHPPVIVDPGMTPKPPVTTAEPDRGHEVVTPPVRDDHESEGTESKNGPLSTSVATSAHSSRRIFHDSGNKEG